MEGKSENETETSKKTKKEAEMENDEIEAFDDEEAMESYGEESRFEAPTVVSCLPSLTIQDSSEESQSEVGSTTTYRSDTYAARREMAMRMKWMTVTGKKPLNVPVVVSYRPERETEDAKLTFFGNRRPASMERMRKENWLRLKAIKEMAATYRNEGRVLREVRFSDFYLGLRCLRFSPTADSMVTSFGNGLVQIRRPDTGDVSLNLQTAEIPFKLEVTAVRYHPRNGKWIYMGGGSGLIQLFNVSNSKHVGTVREKNNEICNLDISLDGSLLVSVGKDSNIRLYDTQTLRLLSLQKNPVVDEFTTPEKESSYHHMRIYGLRCHPINPNIFVTGGWDYTVKVWDTRTCGAVTSIHGPRICGDSIDGNEILTGSWQASNSLKLWDLSSGKLLQNVTIMNRSSTVDGEYIYVAKFFTGTKSRNLIIAGGNGSEEVIVVNLNTNMVIASFPAMKAVTALDCYGDVIAYGGMESLLRIGDLYHP